MALKFKTPLPAAAPVLADYSPHLGAPKAQPIVGMVSKEKKESGVGQGPVGETKTVHPGVFGCKMQITIEGGRTLNLGNYNSARIGVTVTVPCDPETLGQAYDWATGWVSERIDEAVKDAKL